MKNALVIGSSGAIGSSLVSNLNAAYRVSVLSRENCDFSEEALLQHRDAFSKFGGFEIIICCVGVLHNQTLSPEKRFSDVTAEQLLEYFRINTVIPSLCLKIFLPLLKRPDDAPSFGKFAVLSAMVGSIEDNKLGGWYGYRSSKAALNMMLKTAAIESGRSNKKVVMVAIHPGTTKGPLSRPYSKRVRDDKYYSPLQSAERIVDVVESLTGDHNGLFLNWDGSKIPW